MGRRAESATEASMTESDRVEAEVGHYYAAHGRLRW